MCAYIVLIQKKIKVVDADSVQDVMSFDENNRTLVLNTKDSSDYVLVISNAEKYKELGVYCVDCCCTAAD